LLRVRIAGVKERVATIPWNVNIDINEGSIVGMYGKGKKHLISTISGQKDFQGDIILGQTSLKGDTDGFLEQLSVFADIKRKNETTLSVKEYIDFCEIIHCDGYKDNGAWKKDLMLELGLFDYREMMVKELSFFANIKLGILIAFLKRPRLVLLDASFFNDYSRDMEVIIAFCKRYAARKNIIVLLIEDKMLVKDFCGVMYAIDNYIVDDKL
jgi:ABC-type multidrug transport system ATPase subunit